VTTVSVRVELKTINGCATYSTMKCTYQNTRSSRAFLHIVPNDVLQLLQLHPQGLCLPASSRPTALAYGGCWRQTGGYAFTRNQLREAESEELRSGLEPLTSPHYEGRAAHVWRSSRSSAFGTCAS
jgi:hypothetical protein